eukprot:408556-Heterocapsa_arctica.AAC.1
MRESIRLILWNFRRSFLTMKVDRCLMSWLLTIWLVQAVGPMLVGHTVPTYRARFLRSFRFRARIG